MRILQVSKFLHHVGGVETYLRWVSDRLSGAGHEIGLVGMTPPDGKQVMNFPTGAPIWSTRTRDYAKSADSRVLSAATSVWSPSAGRVMAQALAEFGPDVVHFHGTCYQLTSSVVREVVKAGIGALLTAHEAKLICANQTLWDDAHQTVCTACVGVSQGRRTVFPIQKACMKGSRSVSLLGAVEGQVSRPTWRAADPTILAPSRYMQRMLLADGWGEQRVGYLDLAWRRGNEQVVAGSDGRDAVTFLGRLVKPKGADILLRAWSSVADRHPLVQVRILGDGPERRALEQLVRDLHIPRVTFLGHCPSDVVRSELQRSLVTLHPGQWHDNSPFSVRESLMAGVPAMVTELGGASDMVGSFSGWVVRHDNQSAWTSGLDVALASGLAGSDVLCAEVEARATTEEAHIDQLVSAYQSTIERRRVGLGGAGRTVGELPGKVESGDRVERGHPR